MNGQWVEDDDGFLYIIPVAEEEAGVEGPDNAMCDQLEELHAQFAGECLSPSLLAAMGLHEIPDHLKRFSPEEGYYHA
jgi:hypothetical protein